MASQSSFSVDFSTDFGEQQVVSISPTASVTLPATTTTSNIGLPTTGTPTIALITNIGPNIAFLAFGTSNAVTAVNGGMPVLPGTQIMVTIGSFTFVAAITLSGAAGINITTCT